MQTPDHWLEEDNALNREFQFADFSAAFAFMTRVAMLAETANHHPEWVQRLPYRKNSPDKSRCR